MLKITINRIKSVYCSLPVNRFILVSIVLCSLIFNSCSKLGYGILLWSMEDPPISSGTVLPVYIRSNIEQLYVVGVPETSQKIEIPLTQLEFCGSKRKAQKRARDFAEFASTYAESMQDGLPIRENPDNSSRRAYRLRLGEIVKILEKAKGNPPIGATGEPLPGDWLVVLTNDGTRGYCFSYRLKVFDHTEGAVIAAPVTRRDSEPDPDLNMIFSKSWSPEIYQQMYNSKRYNLDELEKRYRFDPGRNTGVARIIHPALEREFKYDGIFREGDRSWFFDGANLQMTLRTDTTLAVNYMEYSGVGRTVVFTALPVEIDELINQEKTRREDLFLALYNQGPVFTSNNYGTITLKQSGEFNWADYDLLVPQFIPVESAGNGRISMDIFVGSAFADRYTGAVNFIFTDITSNRSLVFLYILDNQGLRLEVIPDYALEDDTITRRSSNPMTLYFFRDFSH
ncbi:MAG: SH3 domain-containing protein [Treponema sp.]|jgi:hypothetical protein|nr:SH3 domain-containing protein [Treponema sp.]